MPWIVVSVLSLLHTWISAPKNGLANRVLRSFLWVLKDLGLVIQSKCILAVKAICQFKISIKVTNKTAKWLINRLQRSFEYYKVQLKYTSVWLSFLLVTPFIFLVNTKWNKAWDELKSFVKTSVVDRYFLTILRCSIKFSVWRIMMYEPDGKVGCKSKLPS